MFVLYYFEQDYDYSKLEILKVSTDRTKLEREKIKLAVIAALEMQSVRDWMNRKNEFYKQKCNEVADWFENNMDAILEYPRGQQWGKWDAVRSSFSLMDLKTKKRDYPDWHTSKTTPYHPDVVLKHKKDFIKSIRDRVDYNPWQSYEVYVDHSKVKTPFPSPEKFEEPQPQMDNSKLYQAGTLYIEEVEEI